ncbi:M3 family oligoendopeptidase [Anaerobacillus alkaliphilus]|uniref:M3 family oligoendopeptidase n=1 Tax=Anaerobacillus alkaliphilus TaxID=1548597 RepID=A0A4Q0VR13_9BACI|nr:M3 family oligoendopeptidase [Anaerobacillus alkaliphilus]RXI97810.1 M3 family oligoendopeptidase [Anaerobacillus alkaliphilus]
MATKLSQVWDLDSIFPGGSESSEFQAFLETMEKDLKQLHDQIHGNEASVEEVTTWILEVQELAKRSRQAGAFLSCLSAQNVKDAKAKQLLGTVSQTRTILEAILTNIDDQLLNMPEEQWATFIAQDVFTEVTHPLLERRLRAKEKLSPREETLIQKLAVDGYHAWGQLYDTIVGRMKIAVEEDGKVEELSVGQAANKMSSGNRELREHVSQKWEEAWANEADLCSDALNHLAGYRLQVYGERGWEQVLKEPLEINRMTQETLDAMWNTITENKPKFVQFLDRKAELLGIEKLSWHDVFAPLSKDVPEVSYDEAADIIVNQFEQLTPKMAEFTKEAFAKSWIEAESRAGKRPGGFCTSFPLSKESRIFMTYAGTASNVSTLAHELGHAFHQHVMNDLPYLAQGYAMNVAETASTFAEMVVADATVKNATTKEEHLTLLEDKISRSVAFFMNIHSRFLFETRFYEERKNGLVSVTRLNDLMEEAQKEAFNNSLGEYHPHFWASKLHFYITGVPFYNFPYTFGYLFSMGIYALALKEGEGFEEKYINLLRDTGRMRVEDLAMKHLHVDLTKPEFWQEAVDLAAADVDEFLKLTEK